MKHSEEITGKYAYLGLDRVMHEKARLSIMTSLFVQPKGLDFNALKSLCDLTDGNLSRHLYVLKEHKLIKIIKDYKNNKPYTVCLLTPEGREKFVTYMHELEKVVQDTKAANSDATDCGVILKPLKA